MLRRLRLWFEYARPFTLLPPLLGMVSGAVTAYGAEARALGGFAEVWRRHGASDLLWVAVGALMAATLNAASNILNQLCDLENDRVNKPHRPLPSGRIGRGETVALFSALYAAALALAWTIRPRGARECFWLVLAAAVMTVLYSVPPFRFKRHGLLANFTIALPRGGLLKVAGWSLVGRVFGDVEPWFIGAAFFLFLLGATTSKDFADMEGDRRAGCRTLPVRYGVRRAAWMSAPFFVVPWLLFPLGTLLHRGEGRAVLSGNPAVLSALGVLLFLYGGYVAWLMVRRPEALATEGENHPSWTHMYRMMMLAQVGLAVAYVV